MPELYQTIFKLEQNSAMIRALEWLEQASIRFAHLVLTPNETFRQLFCARGCPESKIRIVMNSPDESIFLPQPAAARNGSTNGKFNIMYHGLIAERHGLAVALEAVQELAKDWPGLVLNLYGGRNSYTDKILSQAKTMALNGAIQYHGKRKLDDIPAAIGQCDLGIIPNLRTPFTEINFPTRIFEYLSIGKPVIAPRTKGICDYFNDENMIFFEPDDSKDLARKIRWVHDNPEATQKILEHGMAMYSRHCWRVQRTNFVHSILWVLGDRSKPVNPELEPETAKVQPPLDSR